MSRVPASSFEDLIVWQKAHDMIMDIYRATRSFPKEELYGLTSQLRRAAVSVAANIAEGFPKRSVADKARYFNIAEASLSESRYYIILARDLGYLRNAAEFLTKSDEVGKLLSAYVMTIRNRSTRNS